MPKSGSPKRVIVYAGICAGVIALTCAATYVAMTENLLAWTHNSGAKSPAPAHLFDLFSGHDVCKAAIYKAAPGTIITLQSDDRAAKYNAYDDSNVLTFEAEINPSGVRFLSQQRSTYKIMYRCYTSSVDNKVLKLSHLAIDEQGIK